MGRIVGRRCSGKKRGLTPPARQEYGRQEDDSSVVFPNDHALDDPALLEMRLARPQREIDLEALDYHLLGY
ncbi:MAG: hypothetical protein K8T91_22950, partial [Planctomycetes bacterium]|nr:hypothetical protein [Planctomycetota bacterium]